MLQATAATVIAGNNRPIPSLATTPLATTEPTCLLTDSAANTVSFLQPGGREQASRGGGRRTWGY